MKLEELKIEFQPSPVQLEAILTRIAGSQDSKLRKLVTNNQYRIKHLAQTVDLSGMRGCIFCY